MRKHIILVALLSAGFGAYAQEKTTDIQEVTIANKTEQQLHETGKNITLITAKDLEKFQGQNLSEILQQVSGFQITSNFNNPQEPKTMRIRGGNAANVLVLIDSVPLKDVTGANYNAMDLRLLASENIQSIEILNGASSVLYGSNATVSVINVKTKKNANRLFQGEVGVRGGSFDTYAQNLGIRGSKNGFFYQLNGLNESSIGLSSAEGKNFDKDGFEKQNIRANVGYENEKFTVQLNSEWHHHLFSYDAGAFTDGKNRGDDQQFYVGGNASFHYKNGKLTANLRHSTNERVIKGFDGAAFIDNYVYKGDNFFGEIFNTYQFTEWAKLTGGFQYEKQSMAYSELPWGGTAMQEVLKFDDTNIYFADVFLNANFKYKNFRLDAGARMVNHSKFKDHFVYNINPYYLYEFDHHYFKIGYSYATAFIAPTLYQNFGDIYTAPNFDLKPETNESHEVDLSFGNIDHTLVINATLFQRNEKEAFAYGFNGTQGTYINAGNNKVKGFETGFDYAMTPYLKVGGNYTFVEKDNAATMLRQPKHRVNSYIEAKPFSSTRLTLSHQFVSDRKDVYYDNSYVIHNVNLKDFNLFNVNINQKINHKLDAYLNIGNLFDKSYTDVVGYTTRPRFYNVGLNYKF